MNLTKEQRQNEIALEFVKMWDKKLETWIKDPFTRGEIIKEFHTDCLHLAMNTAMIYAEGEEDDSSGI